LSFLDDDRPALKNAAGQFLDREFRPRVGFGFDEREAARASRLAVKRDANAADFDSFRREGFPQLLLVDVVREVADEKTRTHPA
jgi:hypothetical protein